MGVVSFGGGKVLSAGRGGALVTSDAELAQRARIAAGSGSGPYALSELQAAVVVAQLPWLQEINHACRHFFGNLAKSLCGLGGIEAPFLEQAAQAAYYQAGFLVNRLQALEQRNGSGLERLTVEGVVERLRRAGVPAGGGFAGFHRRSTRRCDVAQPLHHAPRIAVATLTIHHSAVWKLSPTSLAAILAQTTS